MPEPWPLVGRDEELGLVERAIAGRKGAAAVILAGEGGVGKTRLAREALDRAERRGLVTAWAVATTAARAIPLGAVVHLLPDVITPRMTRQEVLQAAADTLLRRTPGRLVLGIDDAHLLDDHTAVLVHRLALDGQAFVVASVRTGEPAPDPIVALWKDEGCPRIELQALSQVEMVDLLERALGHQVEAATARRLWMHTRGNPLFVRELVIAAIDSGAAQLADGVWRWRGALEPSLLLTEIIAARLSHLDPEARDLLEVIAFAEPIEVRALQSTKEQAALEHLERSGIVAESESGRRAFVRCAHPLYAQAIQAATPPSRMRVIAGGLADALEASGMRRKDDLLRLASWHLAAGRPGRPSMCVPAGALALGLCDYASAERFARSVVDADDGAQAALILAQAVASQGRASEADDILSRLQARSTTDIDRIQAAAARAQNLMWNMDEGARAIQALDDAATDTLDEALRIDLLAVRAYNTAMVGRLNEAIPLGKAVLDNPAASDLAVCSAVGAAAQTLMFAGRPDEGLALLTRHEDRATRGLQATPYAPTGICTIKTNAALMAGRFADAATLTTEAYQDALGKDADWVKGYFAGLAGWVARIQGRVLAASRLLRDSISLLHENDVLRHRSVWLAELAHCQALMGDVQAAEASLAEAEEFSARSLWVSTMCLDPARVWVAASGGERSKAVSVALERADAQREWGWGALEAFLLHDVARLGEPLKVSERLAELAENSDGRLVATFARHARALASRDGEALEEVSRDFEDMHGYLFAAEAIAEAERAHRDSGRKGTALAAAARGEALLEQCAGVRTPALEGMSRALPLTKREREVAMLAARGLATREIAQRLVLSARTIENHLHSAYTKLGIKGREELGPILDRTARHQTT